MPLPKVRPDLRFWIGLAFRMIKIPEAGDPAPAKQVIKFFDFFRNIHSLPPFGILSVTPIDAIVEVADHLNGDAPAIFQRPSGALIAIAFLERDFQNRL